jgi:hypothetical protein
MLNLKTGTFVLIINIINEYESGSKDRVLSVIRQFLAQKLKPPGNIIKLLMLSKNNVDLTKEIEQYLRVICLDNTVEVRGVKQDIKLVVKD